jgi:hypothetical protein
MFAIRITRNYRVSKRDRGALKCANIACNAILEPPYTIHEFTVGDLTKIFRRPFCVNCIDALERAGPNIIVEVY